MSNLSVKAGDFCWVPKVAQGMRLYESLKLMALSNSGLSFLGLGFQVMQLHYLFRLPGLLHERSRFHFFNFFKTELCLCLVQGWGQIGRISSLPTVPRWPC